jgi:hypothetical protein
LNGKHEKKIYATGEKYFSVIVLKALEQILAEAGIRNLSGF